MIPRRQKPGHCGWCGKKLEKCWNKTDEKWEEICTDAGCIRYGLDQMVRAVDEEEEFAHWWI